LRKFSTIYLKPKYLPLKARGWGDKGTRGQGDGGTRGWGDKGMGGQGDKGTRGQGDGEKLTVN